MTTAIHSPAQTLSFPRSTFAKLSPHPYLLAHLQPSTPDHPSVRANGRLPKDFRPPLTNTSSLSHCSGSAVVRIGDTAVVCGIRAEILLATDVPHLKVTRAGVSPVSSGDVERIGAGNGAVKGQTGEGEDEVERDIDMKSLDLLVPNIEMATGCAPSLLPGQPPSPLAQSLSTRIREAVFSTGVVSSEGLGIWYTPPNFADMAEREEDAMDEDSGEGDQEERLAEIKAFWTLYIDVLFISLDGNPFDAAWAAVIAALHDVKLPRAYWDADREMILCSDALGDMKGLQLKGLPVAVTAVAFKAKDNGTKYDAHKEKKHWILMDPDMFEERLCDESVTVMVDCSRSGKRKILGISKSGGGLVGKQEIRELLGLAEKRWTELAKAIQGT